MNAVIILLIIAVLAGFFVGLFVWSRDKTNLTNIFFWLFTSAQALLSLVNIVSLNQVTTDATLNLARWAIFVAILYSLTLFLTIHTFPSRTLKLSKIKLGIILAVSAIGLYLTRTPLIFANINGVGPSSQVVPGPLIPLFAAITGFLIFGSIYILIVRYRASNGLLKAQLQSLLLGVIISSLLIFITDFILVVLLKNATFLMLSPAYTLILIGFIAYAILAHHMFDIRVIIKKTVVYSGLLLFAVAVYSMVVYGFASFVGSANTITLQSLFINVIAAFIVAISLDPIRNILAKATDKYLFVGEYNPQTTLAELAQTLTNVLDLDEALKVMMTVLTKALRAQQSATFILTTDKNNSKVLKRVQSVGYDPNDRNALVLNPHIIAYFDGLSEDYVVAEQLKIACEQSHLPDCEIVVTALDSFHAAVALPIRITGKLIGILVVGPKLSGEIYNRNDLQFLDVAAKQTASAIQKSRFYEDDQMKSEFVSIASHELLTPTAAIEGYLSMILDEKMASVDPKAEAYLRKVQSSAHRLGELVKDLLSVSRIEGGRIVINKQPIDASPIIQQAIDEIQVRADESSIHLSYLAPTQPLPKVLADPDRLSQIMTNLISNAIKYNRPNGSIQVSTALGERFLTVHVADSGIGISPAHIPHLFKKFYRVHDDSAAAEKVGTGLGLYITRSIIELQGGQISVISEANRGSVFSFTLPYAQ